MSSPWGLKARVKANPQTHMVNDASVVTVDMLLRVPRGLDEREKGITYMRLTVLLGVDQHSRGDCVAERKDHINDNCSDNPHLRSYGLRDMTF